MKSVALILIIIIFPALAMAQYFNHVPNPSFEDKLYCPNGSGELRNTGLNWYVPNSPSPGHYHTCSGNAGVPANYSGYQQAYNGVAYASILTHTSYNSTEYIITNIQQLVPGLKYEVSIHVSRAEAGRCATDNLGVFFF